MLTIGTRIRAISGVPIIALDPHDLHGPNESFLLPRGVLGRTGLEHGVDLHLVWAKTTDQNGAETSHPTARNPNFGHTVARYAPASAQVGFRVTF